MNNEKFNIFEEDEKVSGAEETVGEMTWPKPFSEKSARLAAAKHAQLARKKRVHSASFSHSGANGCSLSGIPSDVSTLTAALRRSHISGTRLPFGKNSKKSRDGRRLPNKRGGKNVVDPTDGLDEIELDHADPDYDSDANDPVTLEKMSPSLPDEEADRMFVLLMKELFNHGITDEVVESLADLNLTPHQLRRLPYLAITTALQHKQTQFELTSELLSDLYGKVLTQAQMQQGFLLVLNEIGDLVIDAPKAPEHVGRFIARAVQDEILPPKFIDLQKAALSQGLLVPPHGDSEHNNKPVESPNAAPMSVPPTGLTTDLNAAVPSSRSGGMRNLSDSSATTPVTNASSTTVSSGVGSASSLITPYLRPELALEALAKAEESLTLCRAFAKLDNIWGVPAGSRATKSLVKKIHRLLQSYCESGDLEDATERLLDLDCPHFHHELVFQAVVMAVELSTDEAREKVVRLLDQLCDSCVITSNQLQLGVRRVYSELPELQVDVPAAYPLTERFITAARQAGFVSQKLARELPTKPRKRFISETDSIYRTNPSACAL